MSRKTLPFVLFLLVTLCSNGFCFQDKHIVSTWSYIYGEFPPRDYTDEYWIGENAAAFKSRTTITVLRFDLDKVWIINTRGKKYFEQSIGDYVKSETETDEKEVTIHELGWDYYTKFDWTIKPRSEKKVINGWNCKHYRAFGEADFSETRVDLWLSSEVDIPHKDVLKDIIFKPPTRSEWNWQEAAQKLNKLSDDLIVSCTVKNEPPIADTITFIKTISKIENAAPPEGIYEIPEGTVKVSSLEELY